MYLTIHNFQFWLPHQTLQISQDPYLEGQEDLGDSTMNIQPRHNANASLLNSERSSRKLSFGEAFVCQYKLPSTPKPVSYLEYKRDGRNHQLTSQATSANLGDIDDQYADGGSPSESV